MRSRIASYLCMAFLVSCCAGSMAAAQSRQRVAIPKQYVVYYSGWDYGDTTVRRPEFRVEFQSSGYDDPGVLACNSAMERVSAKLCVAKNAIYVLNGNPIRGGRLNSYQTPEQIAALIS